MRMVSVVTFSAAEVNRQVVYKSSQDEIFIRATYPIYVETYINGEIRLFESSNGIARRLGGPGS